MTKDEITIDQVYLKNILKKLLSIPSPTGFTDEIVHFTGEELKRLGIEASKGVTKKAINKYITREVMVKIWKVIPQKIITKAGEKSLTSLGTASK